MQRTLFILAAGTLVAACGGSSSDNPAPQTGDVQLSMTDAPADDLTQVQLTLNAVALKPAQGSMIRRDLDEPLVIEDLLALQGAKSTVILPTTEVPAGRYNWIRLYVQSGDGNTYVIDDNGGEFPLYVPGQQNNQNRERHVQLVSGFVVPVDGEVNFTLDVDLRRAITKPTNKDYYLLRPAIRIVDNSKVGIIQGTISDSLIDDETCTSVMEGDTVQGNAVYLYTGRDAQTGDVFVDDQGAAIDSDNPVTTATVNYNSGNDAYEYQIGFVPEGDYTLAFTCQALDDMPDTDDNLAFSAQRNVSVTAEQTEIADLPKEGVIITP
ncbi:DUF4382 domain-containing protein [uncultured Alcanivorax sp.]|uniref:DUF4382 domain-containing protein n=1 Tax=uncultured Alcanivorax sp. TaxID=191215 RepID=UPI002613AD6E|nr:DUF4382 domain-containing protein [uncultured Alcanivorax sp.]